MLSWIAGSGLGLAAACFYSYVLGKFWKGRWSGKGFSIWQLSGIVARFGGIALGLLLCHRYPGYLSATAFLVGLAAGFTAVIFVAGLRKR